MRTLIFFLTALPLTLFAQTGQGLLGVDEGLALSDHTEAILQEMSGYEGQFQLESPEQADLMLELAEHQEERNAVVGSILDGEEGCPSAPGEQEGGEESELVVDRRRPCGPRVPRGRKFRFSLMVRSPMTSAGMRRTSYSEASFSNDSKAALGRVDTSGLSLQEAHQKVMQEGASGGGPLPQNMSEDVFDTLVRNRIVNAGADERAAIYQEAGELMPFERQMQFIAKLGDEIGNNYDSFRESQAISAEGVVGCDDILTGLGSSEDQGVCRDMHICMAQVLEGMGNKGNVYAVSFASPGSYHVTLVASDPDNPSNVHKVNYDEIQVERDRGGVSALDQDHSIPDVGTTYRIWKPDGSMVASLPSEMGLVLNEVTGGTNDEDFDPFVRSDYQLMSMGLGYGPLQGNVFRGTLSNGDRVMGVATYLRWGDCSGDENSNLRIGHRGRVGLAYSHRDMDLVPDAFTTRHMDVNQLYLSVQEEVFIPWRLSENVTIEPYIQGRLAATGIQTRDSRETSAEWTGDADLTVDTGIRATASVADGAVVLRGQAYRQSTLGLTDIRGLLSSDPMVVGNHTVVAGEAEIHPDKDDKVVLFVNSVYAMRGYGNTVGGQAGVQLNGDNSSTRLFTGYQAPVGEVRNGWMPGGARPSFTAGLEQRIFGNDKTRFDLNATFRQDIGGPTMVTTGMAIHWR